MDPATSHIPAQKKVERPFNAQDWNQRVRNSNLSSNEDRGHFTILSKTGFDTPTILRRLESLWSLFDR